METGKLIVAKDVVFDKVSSSTSPFNVQAQWQLNRSDDSDVVVHKDTDSSLEVNAWIECPEKVTQDDETMEPGSKAGDPAQDVRSPESPQTSLENTEPTVRRSNIVKRAPGARGLTNLVVT